MSLPRHRLQTLANKVIWYRYRGTSYSQMPWSDALSEVQMDFDLSDDQLEAVASLINY